MIVKPELTPEFCLHVAINASPYPSRFKDNDDPTRVTLFALGVVGTVSTAFYVEAVKNRIFPWHIDDSSISATPDTAIQAAADSIQTGAF